MSLLLQSCYVVVDALDHPIDSRINLTRKLFEFCDLIGSKNRPNLFAKMRALHREISFELPDTASLGTDGRRICRRGVNRSAQGATLLNILFHERLEAWLSFAQDCMNLSFLTPPSGRAQLICQVCHIGTGARTRKYLRPQSRTR
jgi:hypothetical protein